MSPTSLKQLVCDAHRNNDYNPLVGLIPYAKLLGIERLRLGNGMVFRLPANKNNIGSPTLPTIHSSVIAGSMEYAAMLYLLTSMSTPHLSKIIDFPIDYLRTGHLRDTYARCQVRRQGRWVANVATNAWQTTQDEPAATARAHFRVDEP